MLNSITSVKTDANNYALAQVKNLSEPQNKMHDSAF